MKTLLIFSLLLFSSFVLAQSWQQLPDFPGLERDDAVAVTVGNKAYYGLGFAVGFVCMNDWWSFDKTNGWQQKTPFPGTARQYAAAAAVGRYVYVFGGIDQNIVSLNDLWRYDTENDSWEQLASLPSIGRQAPMVIGLHDKVIIGMGRNNTSYFNDCWLYDPETNSYLQITSYPNDGRYYPVYSNIGGNPFITHGKSLTSCFDDAMYYSTDDDTWISLQSSPHNGCNYVAAASHAFHVFLGSGLDDNNDFLNTYFEFNLRTNQWNSLPDLPSIPRKGASMFVLDGALYLIGGIDSNYTRLKEIWKYDFIEIEPTEMEISPNPATSYLNIYLDESMREFCDETLKINLFDITGKLVIQNQENRNGSGLWFFLDVSALKPGMYIVQIENCKGVKSEKVIVE